MLKEYFQSIPRLRNPEASKAVAQSESEEKERPSHITNEAEECLAEYVANEPANECIAPSLGSTDGH
jgi:hypothetical protein